MKLTIVLLSIIGFVLANNWETYPSVKKSASINGFADPLYDKLPKCAEECVKQSTGNTPCPKWDTGCLCIMPQWSGIVAECIAENCEGSDVKSASSLALSLCSSVGANKWEMPASVSTKLNAAADAKATAESADKTNSKSVSPQSTAQSNSAKATNSNSTAASGSTSATSSTSADGGAIHAAEIGTVGTLLSLLFSWVMFM
ncbi:hypothetical protein TRICI_004534 [Trichomonascus ciferrii]|uniref:CFEM domain-containing protein n=1 Tax=Trichomonascus ciferrii TaxID=44093 RepID=A0A642V0M6_9ASCO|nr:hypothetical protein TRICI_004534 [Trichomonascus ciferrii]